MWFDASKEKPFSFDPIPEGIYRVEIASSEEKANSKGTGKVLELAFEVLDGEYAGSTVFAYLNTENPNPKSQQIGRGQISTICRCVKQMELNDPCELEGHRLSVKVALTTRPGKGMDDPPIPSNEVKAFYPEAKGTVTADPGDNPF